MALYTNRPKKSQPTWLNSSSIFAVSYTHLIDKEGVLEVTFKKHSDFLGQQLSTTKEGNKAVSYTHLFVAYVGNQLDGDRLAYESLGSFCRSVAATRCVRRVYFFQLDVGSDFIGIQLVGSVVHNLSSFLAVDVQDCSVRTYSRSLFNNACTCLLYTSFSGIGILRIYNGTSCTSL